MARRLIAVIGAGEASEQAAENAREVGRLLADAGLDRLNHNLNTSESHYPEICSTHTYEDRVQSLKPYFFDEV